MVYNEPLYYFSGDWATFLETSAKAIDFDSPSQSLECCFLAGVLAKERTRVYFNLVLANWLGIK